jgi:ribonuclease HI
VYSALPSQVPELASDAGADRVLGEPVLEPNETPDPGFSDSEGSETGEDVMTSVVDPVSRLESVFLAVNGDEQAECEATVMYQEQTDVVLLHELKNQLAVIPDVAPDPVEADMSKADVGEPGENSPEEIARLQSILEKHRSIFLGEGNALPKPARGVVCDIELEEGAQPIAQRPRRIPNEQLPKVYELLRKLLLAGLIEDSDSEWASPIVLVRKKNGDIRLCIDYRRVNQLIKLMNFPLPLIDELLENFEFCMWFFSMDMASGFWAILMTARAKHISAFTCPLGHFQWVRMPFGLKNAPLIYQKVISNCLWGFVRLPPDVEAEVEPEVLKELGLGPANSDEEPATDRSNPDMKPFGPAFEQAQPVPESMGPVLGRSSYIDDISYGSRTWDDLCKTLDKLLYRLRYWQISVSLPKSSFGKREIVYLSHVVSREGIHATPKLAKTIKEMEFPGSLKGVQSFLGSLNYYHKFIEDLPQIAAVLYELTDDQIRAGIGLDKARVAFDLLKDRIVNLPLLRHPNPTEPFIVLVHANKWAVSAVLAQESEGHLHPVRFTGRVLHDAEVRYHPAEKEAIALLRVLAVFYTILAGRKIRVYTRFSTLKWLYTSRTLQGRCLQWATMLSAWDLEFQKVEKDEDGLAAALGAGITPREKLDEVLEDLIPVRLNAAQEPAISLEMLSEDYQGLVVSFDGAAKRSGDGSASFAVWKIPGWDLVHAEGFVLKGVTVNEAEYSGLLSGLRWASETGTTKLVVAGDSNVVISQCQGRFSCNVPGLQVLLGHFTQLKRRFESLSLIHVKREFNGAADYLARRAMLLGEKFVPESEEELMTVKELSTLPAKLVKTESKPAESQVAMVMTRSGVRTGAEAGAEPDESPNDRIHSAEDPGEDAPVHADPVEVRWERVKAHQEADPFIGKLKRFLEGDLGRLTQDEARDAAKVADRYALDDQGVVRYVEPGKLRRVGMDQARLVVPTPMRSDVLHMAHADVQGGHQGVRRTFERLRQEYHWPGMYRDVERYLRECVDCETARGLPRNPGPSPGNVMPEYPLQFISMDHVGPFPPSVQGNTYILLFQDMFTGYVMCKPMATTGAQACAEAYEEVVFRRFGASSYIRHDRGTGFMSEVFEAFRRMMGSQQRATLAYRPQANGQQERSVQTVTRSIRAYVEEEDQSDWESVVYKLMFALNTSYDRVRRETPHFLMHGWDAKNTMSAMLTRPPRSGEKLAAHLWRLRVQREYEYAQSWARDLQAQAREDRAEARNDTWDNLPDRVKAGFEVGEAVWLYVPRVKPGLSKKLAHVWHGPFRILEKDGDLRVKLKTEGTPYRFEPWVHVSRLKPRVHSEDRPIESPEPVPEELDFDEALLPEDSWEPDEQNGEFEVEELHDVRWMPSRTRSARRRKEYLVKWRGYDEPSWEPVERLNCGRLLYEFDRSARARSRYRSMQTGDDQAGEE